MKLIIVLALISDRLKLYSLEPLQSVYELTSIFISGEEFIAEITFSMFSLYFVKILDLLKS